MRLGMLHHGIRLSLPAKCTCRGVHVEKTGLPDHNVYRSRTLGSGRMPEDGDLVRQFSAQERLRYRQRRPAELSRLGRLGSGASFDMLARRISLYGPGRGHVSGPDLAEKSVEH